jgi:hypothetical protein
MLTSSSGRLCGYCLAWSSKCLWFRGGRAGLRSLRAGVPVIQRASALAAMVRFRLGPTVIILTYVAIDISTFVSVAIALLALARDTQSATIVSAEHFGLATVPLSQFIGWVSPPFAFLIIAVVVRVGHLGRFTSLLGFLTVITSIIGGIAFLHPVTSLQNFQLPALALLGLFSLALGIMLLRLDRKPLA